MLFIFITEFVGSPLNFVADEHISLPSSWPQMTEQKI